MDAVVEELLSFADRLRPMVADTALLLNQALDDGQDGAARGRPGDPARRRPRHLSRSSRRRNATSGGACTGIGHPADPDRQGHRASSRPTRPASARARSRPSCSTPTASSCAPVGHEYGTTTGRPRRCGWYDAVIARYAARINGVTDFVLTKLDVLTGWEQIPVCVAYDVDGVRYDEMPMTQTGFHHATPVYEYFDGWTEDITAARSFEDLPKNAQHYVRALEEMSGAPFSSIGVGPDREQTLELRPLL